MTTAVRSDCANGYVRTLTELKEAGDTRLNIKEASLLDHAMASALISSRSTATGRRLAPLTTASACRR